MAKMSIQKDFFVTKSNTLNEFRPREMTLQELRFFTIYLSKIDPRNESTRVVRFSLFEFQAVMELGRLDVQQIRNAVDGLLTKVTGIPLEDGGFVRFQLFKECRLLKNGEGDWCIEIDAHDRALPLFFDLKSHYFKYDLWNSLRLRSKNQLRMYEVLKQFEKPGRRVLQISELKGLLGINESDYTRFNDFKRDVLDVCQKALAENTDISFIYEPYGKKGRGGKILELKFIIEKNRDYQDPLVLERFIGANLDDVNENVVYLDKIETEAKNNEKMLNFDIFWGEYPEHRRVAKKTALKEWDKLPLCAELFNEIMNGLKKAKKCQQWASDGGVYIPEPANWLRQERWKDAYEEPIQNFKGNNKNQNFKGRNWNHDELAKLEKLRIDKRVEDDFKK